MEHFQSNSRRLGGDLREREMEVRIGKRVWRGMLPVLAFRTLRQHSGSENKPHVTSAVIAANTLVYLRPAFFDSLLPPIDHVWFNPHLILKHGDLKRFFLSAFYHIGEPYLVCNMSSLLWTGIRLETAMGSAEFASMVAALLALSQGITILLSKSLLLVFDYERAYYNDCAVGFSGVLFAMKVVLSSQSENYNVHGVIVPSRYVAWAELVLIQMFAPGVSFLGHLGRILAGLLYLQLRGTYSGPDLLTVLIRALIGALNWPLKLLHDLLIRLRRG